MQERLNYFLLTKLEELNEDAQFYCQFQKFNADKLDLLIYQLIDRTFSVWSLRKMRVGEQNIRFLQAWYRTLRLLQNEDEEIPKEEKISQKFYNLFQDITSNLSKVEKIEILYRFPWHLNATCNMSKKRMNRKFIKKIAQLESISMIKTVDARIGVGDIDRCAIDAIADDVRLDHEEKMSHALRENLPVFIKAMGDIKMVFDGVKVDVKEEDKHAYNTVAYFVKMAFEDEKKYKDLTTFLILAIAKMCFWHVELTRIYQSWEIKKIA